MLFYPTAGGNCRMKHSSLRRVLAALGIAALILDRVLKLCAEMNVECSRAQN
jgi:hypothetical protein